MKTRKRRKPELDLRSAIIEIAWGSILPGAVGGYLLYSDWPYILTTIRQLEQSIRLRMRVMEVLLERGPNLLLIFVCVLVFSMGILRIISLVRSWQAIRQFQEGAISTYATILDRRDEICKDDYGKNYFKYKVVVQFATVEEQVTLEAEVNEKLYWALWSDTKTMIRYASSDPRIALLEGE